MKKRFYDFSSVAKEVFLVVVLMYFVKMFFLKNVLDNQHGRLIYGAFVFLLCAWLLFNSRVTIANDKIKLPVFFNFWFKFVNISDIDEVKINSATKDFGGRLGNHSWNKIELVTNKESYFVFFESKTKAALFFQAISGLIKVPSAENKHKFSFLSG